MLVFSAFDFQVNSAGILQGGDLENTSLENYDKQMNINVRLVHVLSTNCLNLEKIANSRLKCQKNKR